MATKKKTNNAARGAAIAEGHAVRRYLEALEANKPKRGRKRTPDSIQKRLDGIENELADADPVARLNLVQERMNLLEELGRMQAKVDMSALEDEFVKAAKAYSERRGISYAAWREIGVQPNVLTKAGIKRSQ
ncbi:MAG TPA: hypothetical protein VF855_03550 [Acidimicrobiales bacterium]